MNKQCRYLVSTSVSVQRPYNEGSNCMQQVCKTNSECQRAQYFSSPNKLRFLSMQSTLPTEQTIVNFNRPSGYSDKGNWKQVQESLKGIKAVASPKPKKLLTL